MDKKEIRNILRGVVIDKPCSLDWQTLTGDERERMCTVCNMKVHNLSAMSSREAATILEKRKSERVCVYFLRRADGSVQVDNCPQRLRILRNKLYAITASALLVIAYGVYISPSHAGVLVSPSVDPAFGGANEAGIFADYGYDNARDTLRLATAVSFVFAFFFPASTTLRVNVIRNFLELIALAAIPFLIYLAGNFVIGNF